MIARGIRIIAGSCVAVFGGQHDTLAMAVHELAKKRFARPLRVDIGAVDKVAAGLAESIIHSSRLFARRTPAPLLAKGHCA
jgi:hypothetical protein